MYVYSTRVPVIAIPSHTLSHIAEYYFPSHTFNCSALQLHSMQRSAIALGALRLHLVYPVRCDCTQCPVMALNTITPHCTKCNRKALYRVQLRRTVPSSIASHC